jgi:hypothetical protein
MTSTEGFASFNWIRGVADDTRITHMHRLILIRLVAHRGKDGRCDPGYELVAAELHVHRATVIRAVEVGVDLGWLDPPVRHGRVPLNFVFTFPNVQSRSSATSETASEVAAVRRQKKSEVAAVHVRSRSRARLKSQRQRGLAVGSEASTRNGHLTGKENGQQPRAREEATGKKVKRSAIAPFALPPEGTKAKPDHVEQPKPPTIGATWRRRITEAFLEAGYSHPPDTGLAEQWAEDGLDLETVLRVIRRTVAKKKDVRTLDYFKDAIPEAHAKRGANGHTSGTNTSGTNGTGQPQGKWWEDEAICEERIRRWLRTGGRNGGWWDYDAWGPSPDQRGCAVPKEWTQRWTDEHEAAETEKRLQRLYERHKRDGTWPEWIESCGPAPGMPGTKITEELIAKWKEQAA